MKDFKTRLQSDLLLAQTNQVGPVYKTYCAQKQLLAGSPFCFFSDRVFCYRLDIRKRLDQITIDDFELVSNRTVIY